MFNSFVIFIRVILTNDRDSENYRLNLSAYWAIGTVSAPERRHISEVPKPLFNNDIGTFQVKYRVFPSLLVLIIKQNFIAGIRCTIKGILFNPKFNASGICYGKVNELDTSKCHTPGEDTHNRYCQYLNGSLHEILRAHGVVITPFTTLNAPKLVLRFSRQTLLEQHMTTKMTVQWYLII